MEVLKAHKMYCTYKSVNWSRKDMFKGTGPTSPLESISLHWDIWIRIIWGKNMIIIITYALILISQSTFGWIRILQSCELFPIVYEIRYWPCEAVIIYPTTFCRRNSAHQLVILKLIIRSKKTLYKLTNLLNFLAQQRLLAASLSTYWMTTSWHSISFSGQTD